MPNFTNGRPWLSNDLAPLDDHPLRRQNVPGTAGIPTVATTLPTVTVGGANAASTITGAVNVSAVANAAPNTKNFNFLGGALAVGTAYPDTLGVRSAGSGSPLDWPMFAVEFFTDATTFDLAVKDTSTIRVLADGQYIYGTDTSYGYKGASAGSLYNINFSYGGSRQLRRITVECNGDGRFNGVNVGANDSVYPSPSTPRTLVVFGDSFTEPTIADATAYPNTFSGHGFAWRLGQLLGIRNTIVSGSGGAGYVTTGPSSRPAFPDRAAQDIGSYKPDIAVMHTGINDTAALSAGTTSQAKIQAAIEATMVKAWALSPNTVFYLSLNGSSASTNAALRDAQKLAAANHPDRAVFLDTMSPGNIYTGAGYLGSATPSGNCAVLVGTDGTHPTMAGHKTLAYLLYQSIMSTLPS